MAAASKSGVSALEALAKSDDKLAQSSKKVAEASTAQANASKQAEAAIKAEAEADDILERKLAELTREYTRAKAAVTNQIKASGEATQESIKAAAAVKEQIERVKILHQAQQQFIGPLRDMVKGFGAMAGPILALNVGFNALKTVLGQVKVDLTDGVSNMERVAHAWGEVKDLPKLFEGAVPIVGGLIDDVGRLAISVYAFVKNTAEIEAAALENDRQRNEALKMRNAMMDLIDQETAKAVADQKQADEDSTRNAAKILEIHKRSHEQWKKTNEEKKKGEAELASMQMSLAEKAEEANRKRAEKIEKQIEAQEAAKEAHAVRAAAAEIKINEMLDANAERNMERRKDIEKKEAKINEDSMKYGKVAADMLADGFIDVLFNAKRVEDVLKNMAKQIAEMAVRVAIVKGLEMAFGTPFAEGGWVTGGQAGKDSVRAMLMPGERVISLAERRAAQRDPRSAMALIGEIVTGPGGIGGGVRDPHGFTRFADGGDVGSYATHAGRIGVGFSDPQQSSSVASPIFSGGSPGTITADWSEGGPISVVIHQQLSSLLPANNSDVMRLAKMVKAAIGTLGRNGYT